jgi:hypothetical protein
MPALEIVAKTAEVAAEVAEETVKKGFEASLEKAAEFIPDFENEDLSIDCDDSVELPDDLAECADEIPDFETEKDVEAKQPNVEDPKIDGIPEAQKVIAETNAEISPYSENVNKHIKSIEELNVYKDLGLVEAQIGDKSALISPDIDMQQKDGMGRTNTERMQKGLAPLDSNGESYNLHHIGQKADSPLAELPNKVHKENDAILHDKTVATEVHDVDSNWDNERTNYWKERSVA